MMIWWGNRRKHAFSFHISGSGGTSPINDADDPIKKSNYHRIITTQSIFQNHKVCDWKPSPVETHLYYLKPTSWAFACLSHVTVASHLCLWEWEWEWEEDSVHHPGGVIIMEEWEWEADTDMVVDGADLMAVVGALVQDLGVADLALAPEVDLGAPEVEEVDDAEGIR
ncbi:hypothetical protein N7451_007762 [Penicillium sp. IBT 35674x]|nr:hypothetical protein N7451_007762 [Penicillium sp. IBT 35674x]